MKSISLFASIILCCSLAAIAAPQLVKEKDIVIYQSKQFYSAFPSVVLRPDGELLVAFRRAPERKFFGEKGSNHTDANSYLVTMRSQDNAATWSDPKLLFAHPMGGSQDPCMVQLRDGTLVCSSYGWAQLRGDAAAKKESTLRHGDFVFLGGYIVRSEDGGITWEGPIQPPVIPGCVTLDVFGNPCPAYNRGQMCEMSNGRLYWAVCSQVRLSPRLSEVHLFYSDDKGKTWQYGCPVAQDETVSMTETSLYETPGGDLMAFIRTKDFDDHTVVVRSTDGGKSFEPWEDGGFQGHPHGITRLPDGKALLVYGYRHKPYGIRARVLDAECRNFATAEEIIVRDDGGNHDIGYPWVSMMADGRVLAVYYFNQGNGLRHIAGTIFTYK